MKLVLWIGDFSLKCFMTVLNLVLYIKQHNWWVKKQRLPVFWQKSKPFSRIQFSMTGSAAGIMLLPSTLRRPVKDNRKKIISLKMYEEKQILNIATNRNQRGLKMFYIECHKFRCPSNWYTGSQTDKSFRVALHTNRSRKCIWGGKSFIRTVKSADMLTFYSNAPYELCTVVLQCK